MLAGERNETKRTISFWVINDTQYTGLASQQNVNVCVFKRNTQRDEKRTEGKIYVPIQVSNGFVIGESESALSKGTTRYSYKFSKTVPSLTVLWLSAITSYPCTTSNEQEQYELSYLYSRKPSLSKVMKSKNQLLVTQVTRSFLRSSLNLFDTMLCIW